MNLSKRRLIVRGGGVQTSRQHKFSLAFDFRTLLESATEVAAEMLPESRAAPTLSWPFDGGPLKPSLQFCSANPLGPFEGAGVCLLDGGRCGGPTGVLRPARSWKKRSAGNFAQQMPCAEENRVGDTAGSAGCPQCCFHPGLGARSVHLPDSLHCQSPNGISYLHCERLSVQPNATRFSEPCDATTSSRKVCLR